MIQKFADWLVYGIFGLEAKSHLGEAVNFFFYDTVKIILLLFLISVVMGVVNAYLPIGRLRHYLTTRRLYGLEYVFAALFGAITPFCSCSSVIHRLRQRRDSPGSYVKLPDYLSAGK